MRGDLRKEIQKGFGDAWATCLGFLPVGLAFGLVVTQAGFAWWWTPLFSTIIYAGSSEFLALSMITQGMGPLQAAFAAFAVNFRHIFYGLTFPLNKVRNKAAKAYSAYSLIDEVYGITSVKQAQHVELSGPRLLTMQTMLQAAWVGSGILGALAGSIVPSSVQGLGFALIALFAVLSYESFHANPDWSLVIAAILFGVLAVALVPGQVLTAAIVTYFLMVMTRHLSPRLDGLMTIRRAKK